jgi:3-methylcrotonyl-CoA carboxylase alpha subunit
VNAGTIEFLVEGSGDAARFYFLEMNTRLQVEHPVTEAVAGVDLVRAQFIVAAGGRLPWTQESLTTRGHAIECRIYAEDTADGFLPQAGPLLLYREPSGPGIRVDSGVEQGGMVAVHYDPLLAKLTALAESRDAAIDRALAALRTFPILGTLTNVPFLIRLLAHPEIRAGMMHTRFIEEHAAELLTVPNVPPEALAAAALGATPAAAAASPAPVAAPDPWSTIHGWGRER